ncbi:MAG: hypothetical protein ACD_75C00880G0001 [uncultured bacterium]|nr:MAG: hypothetical protein ACD_75C00880G0001 [uncultured bacterium]
MLFEIGMYDAGGLWRPGALFDRPGTGFFDTGRKKGNKIEQRICFAGKTGKTRLLQAQFGKKHFRLMLVHLGEFGFNFRRNTDQAIAMGLGEGFQFLHVWILRAPCCEIVLTHIGYINHFFTG